MVFSWLQMIFDVQSISINIIISTQVAYSHISLVIQLSRNLLHIRQASTPISSLTCLHFDAISVKYSEHLI